MTRVQSAGSSILVNAEFTPPLFDWNGVPARFFEMVHGALTPEIAVGPGDFSVQNGNSLDQVWAKYNIFGGASSVVLSSEQVRIQLPSLSSTDYEMVAHMLNNLHSSFQVTFSNRQFSSIQTVLSEHVKVLGDDSPVGYLYRYAIPTANEMSVHNDFVYMPSGRLTLIGDNGAWRASCLVELSEHVSDALYLHLDIALLKLQDRESFESKLDRIMYLSQACMTALDLERREVS